MTTNLQTYITGDFCYQGGNGDPNHSTLIHTIYIDLNTGIHYANTDGASTWDKRNQFTDAEKSKIAGIATGATANDTDANLKARANHTGSQTASTISDFDTEVGNHPDVVDNTAKVSADGAVTTHSDVGSSTKANIKNNLAASVAPTVDNDTTEEYKVGSEWFDTTADKHYICLDATDGAAVWKETTAVSVGQDLDSDTLWNAQGDMVYATADDAAAILAKGTAFQHLRMNSGATAPEWATKVKQIAYFGARFEDGDGTVNGPFAEIINDGTDNDILNRGFYNMSNNADVFGTVQYEFILPDDFNSWGGIEFDIWAEETASTFEVIIYKKGASIDKIYDPAAISPGVASTWERISFTPTGSYTAGDVYIVVFRMNLDFIGGAAEEVRMSNDPKIYYNAK